MKKYLSLLYLTFSILFFTINLGYCEENFFIDSPFDEVKKTQKVSSQQIAKSLGQTKKKWSFFKKDKQEEITEESGYYGTLPNIEEDFKYKKQTSAPPKIEMQTPNEDNFKDENLKKAPFDDALFLDMVIKKEPDSEYFNDLQKIRFALNKLKKCLENKGDIQLFNGCVNMLELHVKNLKEKYEEQSESLKESYIEILNTNYYAKLLGNLKYDANYYSRYVPVQEGQYSKENIEAKEELLLDRINKTLFLMTNET